tara:strand:- start:183 stop:467 length:285 start_codon:yes stop_codon:yes gene_type:complete
MIIKINQNRVNDLNEEDRQNLKKSVMTLNKITTKEDGGILEVFPEKTESQSCNFEKLYQLICESEYRTEMGKFHLKDEKTQTYISSVNRSHYVS